MPVLAPPALTFRDADEPGDASSSGQPGGIFAVEGVPLRIHIPRNMEATQRSRLASLVKRNGGRVEQGLDGCGVAIFDLEQPIKARQTLHAAQAYTPPIQVVAPAWIEECVEAKKLLDVADGAYNPIAIMERKRIRQEKIEAKRKAEMALEQRNGSIAHNEPSSSHAVKSGTGPSVHKKRPIVGRAPYTRDDRSKIIEHLLVTHEKWGGLQVCIELENKYGGHSSTSYQTHLRDNLFRNNNYAGSVYKLYTSSEEARQRAGPEARSRAETVMKTHGLSSTSSARQADSGHVRGALQPPPSAADEEDEIVQSTQPTQPSPARTRAAQASEKTNERLALAEQANAQQSPLPSQPRAAEQSRSSRAGLAAAAPARFTESEKKYLVDRLAALFVGELQGSGGLDLDEAERAELPSLKPPARLWTELHEQFPAHSVHEWRAHHDKNGAHYRSAATETLIFQATQFQTAPSGSTDDEEEDDQVMEEAEEENEEEGGKEEGNEAGEEQKNEEEDEDEEVDQLRSQSSPSKSQEKARTIVEPGQIRNNVIEKQQATSSSLASAEDEALVSEQLGPVVEISSASLLHSDRDPESQLQDNEAGSRVPDTSQRALHHRAKASMRDEASAENQVPNFLAGISSPTPAEGKTNMLPTSSPQVAVMVPAIAATPKELSGRTYANIAVGPSQPLRLEDSDEIAARAARAPRRSVPAVLVEAQTASTLRAPRQPRHTTATGAQEAKAGSSVLPRRGAMRYDGLLVHTPIQEEQRAPRTAALVKKRKLARTDEDDGGREGAISPEKRQEVEEWRERSSAELSRSASEESPGAERRAKRRRGPLEEEEAEARAEFMREVQAFKKDYCFEMVAQVMPVLGDECDVNKARARMERRIARWSNEYGIGRRDILMLIKQAKGNLRLAEELMAQ